MQGAAFGTFQGFIRFCLEIKKCIMLFEGTVPTNTITKDVEKLLEKLKISVFIYDNEVPDKIDKNVEFKPKIRYQIY